MDVDAVKIMNTVQGESSFKTTAVGDHGLACGVSQFHEETFNEFKKRAIKEGEPFQNLIYCRPQDDLTLMIWAFSKGYEHSWSAYNKIYGNH